MNNKEIKSCYSCGFTAWCTDYKDVSLCKRCLEEAKEDAEQIITASTPQSLVEEKCDSCKSKSKRYNADYSCSACPTEKVKNCPNYGSHPSEPSVIERHKLDCFCYGCEKSNKLHAKECGCDRCSEPSVEGWREQIQSDLEKGKFNSICSNETTFKNYVYGVIASELKKKEEEVVRTIDKMSEYNRDGDCIVFMRNVDNYANSKGISLQAK